jgi:5'-nucleotidase
MGKARFIDNFHRRVDPRGHVYYWQGGEMNYDEVEDGTDNGALRAGYISVTPIQFDLTDYNYFKEIKNWDFTFE